MEIDRNKQLIFHVITTYGEWPPCLLQYDRDQSPRLKIFFPENADCEELNYGQGEGQLSINGKEWGVYVSDHRNGMDFVAHDPDIDPYEAIAIVESICSKLERVSGASMAYRVEVTRST